MSESRKIDINWNIWKQAAETVERERYHYRNNQEMADSFSTVVITLRRIGYMLPAERRRILAAIADAER